MDRARGVDVVGETQRGLMHCRTAVVDGAEHYPHGLRKAMNDLGVTNRSGCDTVKPRCVRAQRSAPIVPSRRTPRASARGVPRRLRRKRRPASSPRRCCWACRRSVFGGPSSPRGAAQPAVRARGGTRRPRRRRVLRTSARRQLCHNSNGRRAAQGNARARRSRCTAGDQRPRGMYLRGCLGSV